MTHLTHVGTAAAAVVQSAAESVDKKQTYTKTEACYKLYSRVFWILLPNISKIEPYNFELYRFKVDAFFEAQCSAIGPVVKSIYV